MLGNWDKIENSDADMKKQLETAVKTNKWLSEMLIKVLMVQLTYAMGDNFTSDAAKVLLKMGHGEEALQHMFNSKLRGGF